MPSNMELAEGLRMMARLNNGLRTDDALTEEALARVKDDLEWQAADALEAADTKIPLTENTRKRVTKFTVSHEDRRVYIAADGANFMDADPETAKALGCALILHAMLAAGDAEPSDAS